jgi:hypothetical protein
VILFWWQRDLIRSLYWRWRGTVTPCGISHLDACNPCLPDGDDRGLYCLTCGLRQRLELTGAAV